MKTNQELKSAALAALQGKWASAILPSIIIFAMIIVINVLNVGLDLVEVEDITEENATFVLFALLAYCISALLSFFIYQPIASVGMANAYKQFYLEGDERVSLNMFQNTFQRYWRNILFVLLMTIFVFLWTLLLIIPGLIKGLSYTLAPYILKDNPELTPNEAINLSMKMMYGHKWRLFKLQLSFIGWALLSLLTCGVGIIWLMPYMYTTYAAFYQDVKNEYMNRASAI